MNISARVGPMNRESFWAVQQAWMLRYIPRVQPYFYLYITVIIEIVIDCRDTPTIKVVIIPLAEDPHGNTMTETN